MKNTKFFLILAIVLVFITVGGVSAEAINDSTVSGSANLAVSDNFIVSDNSSAVGTSSNGVSSYMDYASTNVAGSNVNSNFNAVSSDGVSSYGLDNSADDISTYADTSAHVLNDSTYSTYFDADGKLNSSSIGDNNNFILGNLTNKDLNIYSNVTIDGQNTGTLINGTITLYEDGSNSVIQNIIINNLNKSAIILYPGASNITIFNNRINMIMLNGSGSAFGVMAYGSTKNNKIINNKINITGVAGYNYGIDITGYKSDWSYGVNPSNYTIANNIISVNVNNLSEGIYLDSLINALIINNTVVASSVNSCVYGIATSDMYNYTGGALDHMQNLTISSNNINLSGSLQNYGIDFFEGLNLAVENNIIVSKCDHGSMGIAFYKTINGTAKNNQITSLGGSTEGISSTGDALGVGNAAIIIEYNATNSTIVGNIIRTNNSNPLNVSNESSNNIIENNTVLTDYVSTIIAIGNVSTAAGSNVTFVANVSTNSPFVNGTLNVGNVSFYLNGINIGNASVSNGTATLNYVTNTVGIFNIFAVYETNDIYTGSNATATLNVIANVTVLNTTLTAPNSTFLTKSGENYTVTLKDSNGNVVVGQEIAINLTNALGQSVLYWATTNTEGEAKLQINLAYPGVYNITASFAGKGNFTASTSKGSVTIVNSLNATVLTADNMNTTSLSGKNFTAVLKDINGSVLAGREVSFTLVNALGQNKTYWSTTNTEGVAKLPINLAYPSTYYVIVNFPGNNNTAASNTVNATLIISALNA